MTADSYIGESHQHQLETVPTPLPRSSRTTLLAVALLWAAACAPSDPVAPSRSAIPAAIIVVDGNNQSALAGSPLSRPITVKLVDAGGNGIADRAVTFSVSAGEGVLSGTAASITTNQSGTATAPAWTLGKLVVPQQMTVTAGAISATASATVSTQFHADVRFFGAPLNAAYLPAFSRAVSRLNAEVIGQLTPVSFADQDVAGTCGVTGVPPLNEQVGSLVIYASVGSIDGAGGIVASSGPCYVRQANNLAVVGTMLFDAADLPTIFGNGQLDDVVFHELQHVLGFGTLWTTVTPPLILNAGTSQTAFSGSAGIRGCRQAGGIPADCLPAIPLESNLVPSTADGHLLWSILVDVLMTSVLPTPGTGKLLSAMTVGSISDLGYLTNPNVADAYAIPSAVAASYGTLSLSLRLSLSDARDVALRAHFRVTAGGIVSPLPK